MMMPQQNDDSGEEHRQGWIGSSTSPQSPRTLTFPTQLAEVLRQNSSTPRQALHGVYLNSSAATSFSSVTTDSNYIPSSPSVNRERRLALPMPSDQETDTRRDASRHQSQRLPSLTHDLREDPIPTFGSLSVAEIRQSLPPNGGHGVRGAAEYAVDQQSATNVTSNGSTILLLGYDQTPAGRVHVETWILDDFTGAQMQNELDAQGLGDVMYNCANDTNGSSHRAGASWNQPSDNTVRRSNGSFDQASGRGYEVNASNSVDGRNTSNGSNARPTTTSQPGVPRPERRPFACPMAKKDPRRYVRVYGCCTLPPGIKEFKYVKEHLLKAHTILYGCPYCPEKWKRPKKGWKMRSATAAFEQHLHRCERVDSHEPDTVPELLNNAQFHAANSDFRRWQGTGEQNWKRLFETLFPGNDAPSPYYDYYRASYTLTPSPTRIYEVIDTINIYPRVLGQHNSLTFEQSYPLGNLPDSTAFLVNMSENFTAGPNSVSNRTLFPDSSSQGQLRGLDTATPISLGHRARDSGYGSFHLNMGHGLQNNQTGMNFITPDDQGNMSYMPRNNRSSMGYVPQGTHVDLSYITQDNTADSYCAPSNGFEASQNDFGLDTFPDNDLVPRIWRTPAGTSSAQYFNQEFIPHLRTFQGPLNPRNGCS